MESSAAVRGISQLRKKKSTQAAKTIDIPLFLKYDLSRYIRSETQNADRLTAARRAVAMSPRSFVTSGLSNLSVLGHHQDSHGLYSQAAQVSTARPHASHSPPASRPGSTFTEIENSARARRNDPRRSRRWAVASARFMLCPQWIRSPLSKKRSDQRWQDDSAESLRFWRCWRSRCPWLGWRARNHR